MAKALKQIQQYELKVPGIGFHTTRFGTLMFKFNAKNILKLRDALAHAAQYLTDLAVTLIEQEREAEVRELAPPPGPEERHKERLSKARQIPAAGVQKQVEKSIERARAASRRNAVQAAVGDGEGAEVVRLPAKQRSTLVNVGAKPLGAGDMARKIIEKTEPILPDFPETTGQSEEPEQPQNFTPTEEAPKVIISGGFESDDGSLGEPPASIR
jgi:hypothetical protein